MPRQFAAMIAICACAPTESGEVPSLSTRSAAAALGEEPPMDGVESIPVPPADGPQLAPLRMAVRVYARPDNQAEKIGYLRIGAKVARSPEPVSLTGCSGGWYAIRPLGFACADEESLTTREQHPLVRAMFVEPDRSRPMPYHYAFLRAVSPNYLRVPTESEQFRYELRLERHLRNWKKLSSKWDALEVGANDVPLDERGRPQGKIPEDVQPLGMSERFGGDGSDVVPWWLREGRQIPNISTFRAPPRAVMAGRVKRHAGVAVVGSFVAAEEAQSRRFAISTDARLIPADKLKADSGSPFHGQSLEGIGLPVAFRFRKGATFWRLQGERLRSEERLRRRQFVPLTGKVRTWGGRRMVEAKDGRWLRSKDLRVAVKPRKLPWFAHGGRRWIDISVTNQTMVLWQGDRPTYATLVSTGRDGLGDPDETWSTPLGTFRVQQKHVTTTMDSDVADSEFELRDVPWVMYFKGGYALHGAYWHDDFGRPRSHGCVNLSPIDARLAFEWSLPDVPEHWHGAYASESFGKGTIVRIGR